jgi:hypothetical protein
MERFDIKNGSTRIKLGGMSVSTRKIPRSEQNMREVESVGRETKEMAFVENISECEDQRDS